MTEFKVKYQIGASVTVHTKEVNAVTKAGAREKFKLEYSDNCLILNIEG